MSRALANAITVPRTSPALASTIPLILIPSVAKNLLVFSAGLIKDARPDFRAFAPSEALIPPSFMAVMKKARSSMSPPSCLTTGAAFGMAIVISSIATTVWFSTALRKSIVPARSFASTPNAFIKEMVVSRACSCSTPPRTESLVASLT